MGLDEIGSGLSEVDELAQELGMPPGGPLSDAANALEQAFGDPNIPLPPESFRFLIGPPTAGTTPTNGDDPEDHIAQAGRLLDQLGIVGGYGKMAAGILNDEVMGKVFNHDKKFDRPGWLVLDFECDEGLSRLWRAEVVLIRPETGLLPVAIQTAIDRDVLWQALNAPGGPSALPVLAAVAAEVLPFAPGWVPGSGGTNPLWNALNQPANYAPFSDWENPDALDPNKVPNRTLGTDAADPLYPGGKLAVDAADWLEQFARISVARRGPDRFTLGERWWSGLCTEVQDLDDFQPNVRRIKVVLRPRLWKLSLRKQNRIFQDMTAIQIIKQLLQEHQIYDGTNGQLKMVPPPLGIGPLALPGEVAGAASGLGEMMSGMPFIGSSISGAADTVSDALRKSEDAWCVKREICTQYDETDLELFERLCAEEGITFLFKCAERDETLVLCDDPIYGGKKSLLINRQPMPAVSGLQQASYGSIETAWDVRSLRSLVPSTVTMRDYNYSNATDITQVTAGELLPSLDALGGAGALQTIGQVASAAADTLLGGGAPGATQMKEVDYAGAEAAWFEYPAPLTLLRKDDAPHLDIEGVYESYDGVPLAELRRDRFKMEGARIRGDSTVLSLIPGNHISMQGGGFDVLASNPRAPVKLLITDCTHSGSTQSGLQDATVTDQEQIQRDARDRLAGLTSNQNLAYQNVFNAQNVMVRYRPPPPARRPLIHGVQTATVLDLQSIDDPTVADNEATVDKFWRVLIRFHWDRRPFSFIQGDPVDPPATDATLAHACWVRVNGAAYAGQGFGVVFAPRVGQEVLVVFRDGNPDRPVIVGCMNNGVAGEHTFPPGRDRSGKEGNSEPRYISDAARKTESIIRTRSLPRKEKERGNELMIVDNGGIEKIWLYAQHDLIERVRHDHLTTVNHDQSNRVGGNQKETVGKSQTLFVNRKPEAEDDFCRVKTVAKNEKHELGSGSMTKDGRGHEIKGHDSLTVDGNRTESVGTSEFVTVDGKTDDGRAPIARQLSVGGSEEVKVAEMDLLNVSGNREITAKGALRVKAAQIVMSTPGAATPGTGDPEADPENGIKMSPEGVEGHGKGRVQVYAGEDLTITSENDRVLVKAKTSIVIRVRDHLIELDAADGAIRISAAKESELKIGTPSAYVSLKNEELKIEGSGQSLVASTDTEAKAVLTGSKVQLDFEGEIHMNAPTVEYQRST